MSEISDVKEVALLLNLTCAAHVMDPRTKNLLQNAGKMLEEYVALISSHNALKDAMTNMLAADWTGCLDAKLYLTSRAEVDRLLGER